MKNIWKNAILFMSLIGLMSLATSCGSSDDPDPGATTAVYAANTTSTTPAQVTADFKLSINLTSGAVTVSGYDTSWPMPTGFSNKSYSAAEFLALDWDTPPAITGTGSSVSLVYKAVETLPSSAARALETETTYTYVFDKQ
ncbi:hypothetical protein [Flammeovirga kamogawensis]|uniref:Uncharacterized protein n=1 Tax=Flammeovirga kamogawensis TaxID=373891 RepID=A0ABX8GST3_9BACT|nr:hypothetical protein [Flammeovirga kamogawensis]MBB6463374.1 hypothetical protein [Flammeovirga kamogawensis]QWG06654.1 hypothetical protein KM029_15255 [Flammeovirga kamogawensis]TRX68476.1 hypothetical protein EO216_10250 [Flammeovirga kamogawensis]